ncbi:hypothetical protein EG327_009998 [Venturia inaequalis]|uniref:Uncharacterized protein n=1 Tax=Venturia inaequalis TaxID=5025 RepID=A0A8H3UM03_VENIN|nr:hypothetical protein EG327_009998 [Venturia inaequalis]
MPNTGVLGPVGKYKRRGTRGGIKRDRRPQPREPTIQANQTNQTNQTTSNRLPPNQTSRFPLPPKPSLQVPLSVPTSTALHIGQNYSTVNVYGTVNVYNVLPLQLPFEPLSHVSPTNNTALHPLIEHEGNTRLPTGLPSNLPPPPRHLPSQSGARAILPAISRLDTASTAMRKQAQ